MRRYLSLVPCLLAGVVLSFTPVHANSQETAAKATQTNEDREKDFEEGEKGEGGSYILKRQKWFHDQRAFPLKHIPAGVRQRAVKQRNKKVVAELASRVAMPRPLNSPAPPQWVLIGPQPVGNYYGVSAGRVTSVAVNPSNSNIAYAGGAEGGVWKTTNGGTSWTSLTDNQPSLAVGSIALDPTNSNIIYVGTGEENFSGDSYYGAGVLKSTDGGATWTQYCGPFCGPENVSGYSDAGASIGSMAVDPTNNQIVLAAVELYGAQGVYRSTNGGASWTRVSTDGGIATAVVFDPSNAGIAYAASETAGILKSTNHGQTWVAANGSGSTALPALNNGRIALALAPSSSLVLYVGIADGSTGQLMGFYKSTDGATSWNQLTGITNYCGSQCWYDNVIGVSPVNANLVFAGGSWSYSTGNSAALRSMDGGTTWTDQGSGVHPDAHAMAFSADGSILYTGNDGGVWSTASPTATSISWTSLNPTLALTEFYPGLSIDQTNVNHSYAGTQDNGTNRYSGSLDWPTVDCGDGGATAIDFSTPTTVYTNCIEATLDKSTNDGASFTSAVNGIDTSDSTSWTPPLAMDPENSQTLYFGTYRVYQTTNAAGVWTAISPDLTNGGGSNLSTIAVAPSDSNTVYAGTWDSRLHVSRNALSGTAASWTSINSSSLPNRSVTAIAVDPTTPTKAYVGYSGFTGFGDSLGHIFMTTDAGANWTDISSDLPNTPVDSIVVDPDAPQTLFIGTDIGAFYTSSTGGSWSVLGTGLPNVVVSALALHENSRTLRAATHGRSVWDLNISTLLPVPTINTISPASVPEMNGQFTLTVNGVEFVQNSVVQWNGSALATTYVSASEVTAVVPASDVATPGSANVTVYNPTAGKLSNSATLTIYYIASSTTTTLTASPTSGAKGQSFTFKASVTDLSGPETEGSVSFYKGSVLLGTVELLKKADSHGAVGTGTFVTKGLAIGTNAITARFNGTSLDSVSTSSAQNVTVTGLYPTATTLTSSGSQGNYTLTAAVASSGSGVPSGTVTFNDLSTNTVLGTAAAGASSLGFTATTPVTTQSGANDVALGDVDGDGIQDMVVASYNGSTNWITVSRGNGDGTFQTAQPVTTGSNANNGGAAVALADVDGDGNLDIIAASWSGTGIAVFLGNGDGTFGAESDYPIDNGYAVSIAVGDFKGDGKLDIVTSDYFGSTMSILIGNGDGTFQAEQHYATDTNPESITVGDFNQDGKLDAAVINTTGTISIFIGNGDGTFQVKPLVTGSASGHYLGPRGIATGDMNGDGKLDLVFGIWDSESVGVMLGNGDGSFQTAQQFPTPGATPTGVVVADINEDGKADIAVSSYNGSVATVLLGNGNDSFQTGSYTVDNGAGSVAVGDLDGDGDLGVVTLSSTNDQASVLLGQATFTSVLTGVNLPGLTTDNVSATYNGDSRFHNSVSNTLSLASNSSAAATPVISPAGGTYTSAQPVTITDTTGGSTIYYTTNGTTPTAASTKYVTGFSVTSSETIKAIAIATGFANSPIASAAFTINASGITATFTPNSLSFPSTAVGTTSAAQVVTLKNNGGSAMTLGAVSFTGTNASSFLKSATNCPGSLAAGATCTVSLEFKPTATGALTATFSLADSATNSPQTVALSGTGGSASTITATFTPNSLTFPSTAVGATSAAQVVTLKNTGTAAMTLGAVSFTGTNASSFLKSATNCPGSLAAGATCTVSLEFKPTATGTLTATFSLADNAMNSPQTVTLSGTGGSASTITATFTPNSLTFPSTAVGATSAAQVVTLKNTGTAAMTLGAASFTGTNAGSFLKSATNCPGLLAAGATCTVSLEFKPATTGTLTAAFSLSDNATNSPQTVALTGSGGSAPTITATFTPNSLTFASTAVGTTSAAQMVTLTNTGTGSMTLGAVSFTGSNASSFLKSATNCPASLAAGATCTVSLEFKPAATGTLTATFSLADNATNSPQTVALTGTGH